MSYDHDVIRRHLLSDVFLDPLPTPKPLEHVIRCQTLVPEFDALRRNRLGCGYFRYHHNFQSGERGKFDAVGDAIRRLKNYLTDGNQEHLVDAANLCMIEFVQPACHPNPHFSSSDDGEHAMQL